ncbi:MAG: 2,4-dienoyl-CoA reductase-like NADH-dependent reductase (Old Yellow Enzyme family), partial [Planctomycetota bacterium]
MSELTDSGLDKYPTLFSPLKVGNITIRNRIMQSAHAKGWHKKEGLTNDRDRYYAEARAKGGAGLLVTGNRLVHPTSNTFTRGYSYGYKKEMIEPDAAMTGAVHDNGGRIFAQLNHFGVNGTTSSMDDYRVLWSSSTMKSPAFSETPKPMEKSDMAEVKEGWAMSADYAKAADFDGVEVHLSHSYLLQQFISPLFNKRRDEYGGSLENRLRFPLEVIEHVRERVGDDFVVGIRLPLDEMVPGGMEIEEWLEVAQRIASTGMINYIMTTAATYHSVTYIMPPADIPDGWLLSRSKKLKEAVPNLPIFAVGGIKDPVMAESALVDGSADMIAMTRQQIADPEYANKVKNGREDEIIHCIRCNQGCIGRLFEGGPITCILNPTTGREQVFNENTIKPATQSDNWVVVGGGPAGMKAAATLAERGHQVTLLEKDALLGGQVNLILKTPRREVFHYITTDLSHQLDKLGVEVRLNTEASEELVQSLNPDGIILATGSKPDRTGFSVINPMANVLPGHDQKNVVTGYEVLENIDAIGQRVLLLDDDGTRYTGGVAEVLVKAGRDVTIVTRYSSLLPRMTQTLDLPVIYRQIFNERLSYHLNCWVKRIEGDTATTYNIYTGDETAMGPFDSYVLITGHVTDDALYHSLSANNNNVHRIGDCLAPRRLEH